jgi:hypothetical protein
MEFFKSLTLIRKRMIAGAAGTIAGFLYYHYIGCMSGTCAITSNPYISSIYGAAIGMLLVPSPPAEKRG